MGWGGHPPKEDPNIGTAEQQQIALQKQQEDFYEQNIAPQELAQMKNSTDAADAATTADANLADYQLGMSKKLNDDYQQNFRPVVDKVASDAMDADSSAFQQGLVDQATTTAGQQYASTNAGLQRDLAVRGINPGSGSAIAAMAGSRDSEGLARAQAANQTRLAARQMGWQQAANAAGIGGGLENASGTLSGMSGQSRANGVSAAATGLGAVGTASGIDNSYAGTQDAISTNLGNLGMNAWQTALQRNQIVDHMKNAMYGTIWSGVVSSAATAANPLSGSPNVNPSAFTTTATTAAAPSAAGGGGASAMGGMWAGSDGAAALAAMG